MPDQCLSMGIGTNIAYMHVHMFVHINMYCGVFHMCELQAVDKKWFKWPKAKVWFKTKLASNQTCLVF